MIFPNSNRSILITIITIQLVNFSCSTSTPEKSNTTISFPQAPEIDGSYPNPGDDIPEDALEMVGLGEQEFINQAEEMGYSVRVYTRDGVSVSSIDADLQINRLNIEINDGTVTRIYEMG